MQSNDIFWMKLALEQAKRGSQIDEVPVGSVAVCSQKGLIASSHNTTRKDCNPCGHAEIEVIRRAGQVLKNFRLNYV